MRKHWNYFKYVARHKWFVFLECRRLGLTWRGLIHDLIGDTGGNPVEWLLSLSGKDTRNQGILGFLCASVAAQVSLLIKLREGGFLC